MESTRDFGSREVSGKFFQKLSVRWFSPPRGDNQRTYVRYLYPLCAGYTPCPLVVTQG